MPLNSLLRVPIMPEVLVDLCQRGELFALVDPFYVFPDPMVTARMEPRDTDPEIFDIIAWQRVTYEPPYLARIDHSALKWILHTLSTERWGVFVVSKAPIEALAAHFQKFIIARGPDGNPYFFKFHDASVLEVFLQTWLPRELEIFFGPADAFGACDLDSLEVRLWSHPVASHLRVLPRPEECLVSLREQQLRQSSRAIDRDLAKVICWHLRNHHPRVVQYLPQAVLEPRVAFGIRQGRKYKLNTIADLAGFVSLMFEVAPNFDQHPSFQRVLAHPQLPPDQKLKKLVEVISEREWNQAAAMYDRQFWSRVMKKTEVNEA